MKTSDIQRAFAYLGAVIGAGFASGREIVSFFSGYGAFSWLLILCSVSLMVFFCLLCLRSSCGTDQWCLMYTHASPAVRSAAQGCVLLLQAVMGGSMISAAGHMTQLLWASEWAYTAGVLGTLILAVILGFANLRPLCIISSVLSAQFVLAVLAVLVFDGNDAVAVSLTTPALPELIQGSVRAAAYAALNMAIAIGLLCRWGECSLRSAGRSAVLFGLLMTGLLFLSNYLYLKHPELSNATFPMVVLLARFGKVGYIASVLLMYAAILTTLVAVLYAFRTGLEAYMSSGRAMLLTFLLPPAISIVGFEGIVDGLYTPVGIGCGLLVFAPLAVSCRKKARSAAA
ncbi:MAG: hypothetical protein E7319_06280 [Clostridiales bacterium]|nr:hypothetical protein [Clostridiales bacterium]